MRELAERTGLSPALLSQIERGQANTTVEALSSVADALDVTFADLTWRYLAEPRIVRANQGERTEQGAHTVVRTIFGSTERRRFEVSVGVIQPNARSSRNSHGIGSIEYTYVLRGDVQVESEDWSVRLHPGDAMQFSSEQAHSYISGEREVEVLTLVASSDDWDATGLSPGSTDGAVADGSDDGPR